MGELMVHGRSQNEAAVLVQAFQILQSMIAEKDEQIARMQPLAEQAELCEANGAGMDMTAAAGIVSARLSGVENKRIVIGRNSLYELLREFGMIRVSVNQAYQRFVDTGYFVNVAPIRAGKCRESVKVTPRGIEAIIERIMDHGISKKMVVGQIEN